MSFVVACRKCGQKLRMQDEHAGKAVECPDCATINRLPRPSESPSAAENVPETCTVCGRDLAIDPDQVSDAKGRRYHRTCFMEARQQQRLAKQSQSKSKESQSSSSSKPTPPPSKRSRPSATPSKPRKAEPIPKKSPNTASRPKPKEPRKPRPTSSPPLAAKAPPPEDELIAMPLEPDDLVELEPDDLMELEPDDDLMELVDAIPDVLPEALPMALPMAFPEAPGVPEAIPVASPVSPETASEAVPVALPVALPVAQPTSTPRMGMPAAQRGRPSRLRGMNTWLYWLIGFGVVLLILGLIFGGLIAGI